MSNNDITTFAAPDPHHQPEPVPIDWRAVEAWLGTPAVIGPLPATFSRTAYLLAPRPWTPPEPKAQRLTAAERHIALETGTGLDALRLLVPPPETPYLGDRTWTDLFDALGARLPSEYRALMELYGAGCWTGWLRFDSPLRIAERGFLYDVSWKTDVYREHRSSFPEWYPLNAWPEPGGILPFADTIDGDNLCWLTEGDDPDAWPLIVWPRHSDQGPALEHGLVDTLLAWQRGKLRDAGLPGFDVDDDPLDFVRFDAWGEDVFAF